MEEILEKNHTYVVKYGSSDIVKSLTVQLITNKAYLVQWNEGDVRKSWEIKDDFHKKWEIIEDVSDFLPIENQPEKVLEVQTELVPCYICHGEGTIPDTKSTAGKTTCPACTGCKLVPKVSQMKYH